jgi:hypothetical protein
LLAIKALANLRQRFLITHADAPYERGATGSIAGFSFQCEPSASRINNIKVMSSAPKMEGCFTTKGLIE